MASFYTQDPQVKHVVVILIWLNALFMPIWSASWVLPAGFKGLVTPVTLCGFLC